jgi:hypothetical protein
MKRYRKLRIGGIGVASLVSVIVTFIIPSVAALAIAAMAMSVNNLTGTSYTSVPFIANTSNGALISAGQMLPTGLDTRVTSANGTSLPHMLADNYTLFVGDAPAHTSTSFTYTTGNTALSAFKIIPGYSGNITTPDDASLEIGSVFDISISGYFDTSVGSGKDILFKDGAVKLDVSAASTIKFHALNADNSDNWTMTATPVASGVHTVRVYADGLTARMTVDGVETDTEALLTPSTGTAGNDGRFDGKYSRNVFYANGRHWFFSGTAGGNLQYKTSLDGLSWGAQSALTADGRTSYDEFAVWFDGTNVHYAREANAVGNYNMMYRRGVPEADGSITWAAAEQTVENTAVNYTIYAAQSVITDTTGRPVIAYQYNAAGNLKIVRSSTTDGTWSTDAGFTYVTSVGGSNQGYVVPLSGNALYMLRYSGTTVYGRYFNGTSWVGTDSSLWTGTALILYGGQSDAANNIYVGYRTDNSPNYYYYGRVIDSSLSVGTAFQLWLSSSSSGVAVTVTSDGRAFYFHHPAATTNPFAAEGYYRYKVYTRTGGLGSQNTVGTDTNGNTICASATNYGGVFSVANTDGANMYYGHLMLNWTWLDNANIWGWMAKNSMSYADNITLDVGGARRLTYLPTSIILGTTLPDASGNGNDGTFNWGSSTLTVSAAALVTLPATNITTNSATLNGQLLDMVGAASYSTYFDYGLSTSYGMATPIFTISAPGLISANASGLSPNTTYHFRAVAVSSNITLYGGDLTFATTLGAGGGLLQMGGGNARVFKNYITDNDTLVVAEIVNTYTPYYPNQSPKEYFSIQLIDTDNTTILAATPQQDWGDKPIGIYINPTQSRNLTNGANYYVRIQGNFAANVSSQYQLQHLPWANDWKGADLTKLDDWAVYVAMNMQTFYSGSGYVTVLTDRKLAITDAVGGYFTAGIAGIGQVRPNLFTTSQQTPTFTAGVSLIPTDNTTAYTAYVGSTIANDANDLGVPFGMTGRDMLAGALALAMLGVIMTGTAAMGGFGALGLFLISIPILWLGTYFKVVGVQYIMILTIIFGFLFVRQFWIKTT